MSFSQYGAANELHWCSLSLSGLVLPDHIWLAMVIIPNEVFLDRIVTTTMNYLPRLMICLNNTLIMMKALHHYLVSRLSYEHRYSTDNYLVFILITARYFISNRTCPIIMVYQPGCEGKPILNQVV